MHKGSGKWFLVTVTLEFMMVGSITSRYVMAIRLTARCIRVISVVFNQYFSLPDTVTHPTSLIT